MLVKNWWKVGGLKKEAGWLCNALANGDFDTIKLHHELIGESCISRRTIVRRFGNSIGFPELC